ncbi:MAG TPA: hypothetical protein VNS22_07665 [Geminicoccus sp.]|uniref:hypothetical protein n=1 Tax=Geminicoccus sp. TaxID=2024832 RepID=UPI002BCA66DC|nr:hypothetical protein [Geminicoccus sp.]HWL68249.1 hypothetical protein [Geminicoccus sp.]
MVATLAVAGGLAFAAPASAAEPSDLQTMLSSMGLAPLAAQASDRPEDVRSVLQKRFAEVRKSIDRCQTFLGRNFPKTATDAILKGVALKPGGFDAAVAAAHARLNDAASSGRLARHDLDVCVRLVDMRIGGRTEYVRSLEQIDRSIYKCGKVLAAGTPSQAAVDVLRTLDRRAGSPTYTEAGTLAALDRAFGRSTGLTRLDLDTCAAAYDLDRETQPLTSPRLDVSYCPAGSTFCEGTVPGYTCCSAPLPVCAQSCDEDGDCEPYCEPSLSCFPGDATVLTESGDHKPMADVRVGDRVQVVHADGTLGFEDVYLQTHQDAAVTQTYVRLTLDSGRSLVLSPRHFIPTATDGSAWDDRLIVGANEVQAGDRVWYLAEDGQMRLGTVATASREAATGAFNPLTMQGSIVVDGVVASAHSDWFLDGYVSAHAQAQIYQAMFAPVRGIYTLIGPEWTRTIAEDWGVVDAARAGTGSPAALPLGAAALGGGLLVALLGLHLIRRRRARLA